MAGIDDSGFTPETTDDIKTSLESGFRAVFGALITVAANSVFGQIIGIFADRLADVWQLGLAIYTASFREGATGVSLDNIGALTGCIRKPASSTKVDCTLTGTPSTVITAGSRVSIVATGYQFTLDANVTIGGGGTVVGHFTAAVTGQVQALAGSITQIQTPISGWTGVTNALDQTVIGAVVESDAKYRIRQIAELRGQGQGTVAAIRAALSAIPDVTDVYVFSNVSDAIDDNGLPPHSFESVVDGGTDAAVAQAILDTKPVGIASYGTTTQGATDANGFGVDINFSRPEELDITIAITLIAESGKYPTNGNDIIKAALVAYGDDNYHVGSEVRSSALVPTIFAATPGVLELQLPLIGTGETLDSSDSIVVTNRQKASLDSSRVTITVTFVAPS